MPTPTHATTADDRALASGNPRHTSRPGSGVGAVHLQGTRSVNPAMTAGLRVRTVANAVTVLRTSVSVIVGVFAMIHADAPMLVVAYAVYWVGDMLDGFLARAMDQATRLGAVLDIISDRACTAVLGMGLATIRPDLAMLVAVFLLLFMVLDTMLSLAFLCWPIDSPNNFDRVDAVVYRLNWSPPAKALNTAAVVLFAVTGFIAAAAALIAALTAVKIWSARRVLALYAAQGSAT